MAKVTQINQYGDLICPHCKTNIITPLGFIVKAGIGKCNFCKNQLELDEEIARLSNERIKNDPVRCEINEMDTLEVMRMMFNEININ